MEESGKRGQENFIHWKEEKGKIWGNGPKTEEGVKRGWVGNIGKKVLKLVKAQSEEMA